MPFRVGYYVTRQSGIKTFADLKGKKVPSFKPTALGTYLLKGYLANVGVSTDGMNLVSVPNFPRMWDGFKRGTLDTAIAAIGSRPTRDMKAARGALSILPLDPSPAAIKRMREFLPQAYVVKMPANPKLPGLAEATNVGAFDYTLFASKNASADLVYKVTKAMYENEKELQAAAPLWRSFKSAGMSKDVGLTFHPGAIKFYKEKGMWAR
jgi:TRAP transporter TAXI family solute receptor